MENLPKAILFDLDDTILAYDAVGDEVWEEVCQRFAPRIEGLDPGELTETLRPWPERSPSRTRWHEKSPSILFLAHWTRWSTFSEAEPDWPLSPTETRSFSVPRSRDSGWPGSLTA